MCRPVKTTLGMLSGYMGYIVITGIASLAGMFVSQRLKSKFEHYSQVPLRNGMTGKDVAEAMLQHYNIRDVKVLPHDGMLTDHYNPMNKTIMLSTGVYNQRTVAAAAVAAHECGHAVQHAQAYPYLKMRSAIVPAVNIASKAQQILVMLAVGAFGAGSSNPTILLITMATFFVTALFSFVTLPVEFDASKRALVWLEESRVTQGAEQEGAKDALWWAAMTYVAAAMAALVMLLYFFMRYQAASRR